MSEENSYNNILFGFYLAGCAIAHLCQKNIMYTDYHKGNFYIKSDGSMKIGDFDDAKIEDFPVEIWKYARSIMNFYLNFNKDVGAAFRFGFIHIAGNIGHKLYDILNNEYALSCYSGKKHFDDIEIDVVQLKETYERWNELISDTYIYKVADKGVRYDEYYYINLQQKNVNLYHESKNKYGSNEDVIRYEYETYFANSMHSGNKFDFIAALVTLASVEFETGNDILSFYYYAMAYHEIHEHEEQYQMQCQIQQYISSLYVRKYGVDKIRQALINVMEETLYLRANYATSNYYMEIWYWSDFQKEHSVEELFVKRTFSLYKCTECGFEGFQERNIHTCDNCKSKKIVEMSFEDKASSLIAQHEQQKKQERIVVPPLNSVEILPIYSHIIKKCIQINELDSAVRIARKVESFLCKHHELKDEQGYVKVPAHIAGRIFRIPYDPNHIMKLFEVDTEYVKHDYETEIFDKLCTIFMKQGKYEDAVLYAGYIIDLLNNSRRWVADDYAKNAYRVLEKFAADSGDSHTALKYANILFTYDMLHTINVGDRDLINLINSIGEKNANSGNYGLALSCYYCALRHHVYLYGIKHPESVYIYRNMAKLFAMKSSYDDACWHYGFAIMILENSHNEHYDKVKVSIEQELKDCLEKSGYSGTYSEWRKKHIYPDMNSPFPEKNFVQDKKSIEIQSTNEYVEWENY